MFCSQIFSVSKCCDIQGSHLICYLWIFLTNDPSECLVCYFFVLNEPSSEVNHLKTVFILTNQNWVIFSCILLGLKSYAWFQNRTSAQREFDLKSQVWFQKKITWHEVQLPLYYIHFEIAQKHDLVSSNILLMQYWAGLIHISIFGGKS